MTNKKILTKIALTSFLLSVPLQGMNAQNYQEKSPNTYPFGSEQPKPKYNSKIFDVVEEMPMFPGGIIALNSFIKNSIKYPANYDGCAQGRVIVGFVVEPDGSFSDVKVLRSVDGPLDQEAVRIVKSMPKWNPGKHNGKAVRTKSTVAVTFRWQ